MDWHSHVTTSYVETSGMMLKKYEWKTLDVRTVNKQAEN